MGRKAIPKSLRFEVFKRDSFTCQYCGRSAPEVLLEVDHITPVSKGGDNSMINLVTSCRDCNRGKSAKELSDNSSVKAQKKQLDELQQRKEIMEMMVQWRKELMEIEEVEIDTIEDYIESITGYSLTEEGRNIIRNVIKRFGFNEVYEATEISFFKYYNSYPWHTQREFSNALRKIGGVCYNRKKQRERDAEQDY